MSKCKSLHTPLNIGILVRQGQVFEQWELALFKRLGSNPKLSLAAFLEIPEGEPKPKPSRFFSAVSSVDQWLFGRSEGDAAPVESSNFENVPRIIADEHTEIGSELDIVISHISSVAPWPVVATDAELWEYHFNIDDTGIPDLFGFRESLANLPVTRSVLLRRMSGDQRKAIAFCQSNTKFSPNFNADYAKCTLPALVERELCRVWHGAEQSPFEDSENPQPAIPLRRSETGLVSSVKFAGKLLKRITGRIGDRIISRLGGKPGKWQLVLGNGDVLVSPLDNLTELPQPENEYRADPFLFQKDGESYVFFEKMVFLQEKGINCVGRIEGNKIVDVSELDFGDIHNSYPFVFQHNGKIFMIPETHQRQRVEVWRCTNFPKKWSLHATALEGQSAADTVFLEWDNQCWLLSNLSSGKFQDHCSELHVFRVDGPELTQVDPHPLNPVVLGTQHARNGGRPFVRDGKLIRPAQVTSHGVYGYGLVFKEVTELSMSNYSEREIRRIEPDRKMATTGCHHLDSSGEMFIMDVRRAYGSKILGARPIALIAS